jgi:serine/threonine protein kinase
VGTPLYIAPEGGQRATAKADIYACALIGLELMCPRFRTSMERHTTFSAFRQDGTVPVAVRETAPDLADLLKAMAAKDPERRPTAEEVVWRLRELEHARRGQTRSPDSHASRSRRISTASDLSCTTDESASASGRETPCLQDEELVSPRRKEESPATPGPRAPRLRSLSRFLPDAQVESPNAWNDTPHAYRKRRASSRG